MDKDLREIIRLSSLFQNVKPEVFAQVMASGVLRSVEEGGFYFLQDDPASGTLTCWWRAG